MAESRRWWCAFFSLAILPALLLLSCSSGDGPTGPGGDRACLFNEPPPNFPDRNATFTPTTTAASSITLRQGPNCADLLVLELFATNVADLAEVQYTIDFPENVLFPDTSRLGPFLTGNGAVQVTQEGIIQSATLRRPAGQPGVTGSGRIALVAWVYRRPTGTFPIGLTGQAFDSEGNPLDRITFIGGSVTITAP